MIRKIFSITTRRRTILATGIALALLVVGIATYGPSSPASAKQDEKKPTIVLVHGAWADSSGWNDVVAKLDRQGYPVVAVANPLRSLSGDSAYLASVLAQTPGDIVLVGHSYGGAVMTNAAAGNPNVKALVYVAAFMPEIGEDTLHLVGEDSKVPAALEFKGFPPFGEFDVDIYIRQDAFREVFAQDLPQKQAFQMAATQRPAAAAAGGEPTFATAWKDIPSWYLLATQDRTIVPAMQRFMATRAGATIVEVKSSHVAMISKPDAVVKLINTAVRATD